MNFHRFIIFKSLAIYNINQPTASLCLIKVHATFIRFFPAEQRKDNIRAMLSGVIMVVLLMCYCCHKSIRKNRPQEYPQYWRTEPDVHSLEVFTTEAHAACCERQSTGEGNLDESTYGALSCPVTPNSGPGPPPTYDSLIFDSRSLPNFIDKKPEGAETPGIIIPPMVSTLLSLSTTVRSTECNEATEQEISDEGLPSYEAALKLDANGYV
ncbi:uncharacterized protein LOC100645638 isoform X3 [Bombus terrestris]|uniref:Uncharacterized protein LOC100645638 isoform X3 n=1 Tax=Bombus terrestris TaxID=30195 RepID=A0A9B7CXW4_BOMTE|nr:uncharacterized protein LOC100645638 isoform X3 [Bombus terrestris]